MTETMRCDFPDCPEEFHENPEFDQVDLDAESLGWLRRRVVLSTGQRFIVHLCPIHSGDTTLQQAWRDSSARKVVNSRLWPQKYLPTNWPAKEVSGMNVRFPQRDW